MQPNIRPMTKLQSRARASCIEKLVQQRKKVGEKSARSRKCFFFLLRQRQGERIQPNNLFASLILAAANYMQIRKWAIFMSSFIATCSCCQRWNVKEIGLSGLWEKNKEIKTQRFQFSTGCGGRSRGSSSMCQQNAHYISSERCNKNQADHSDERRMNLKKSFWPKFCNDLLSSTTTSFSPALKVILLHNRCTASDFLILQGIQHEKKNTNCKELRETQFFFFYMAAIYRKS